MASKQKISAKKAEAAPPLADEQPVQVASDLPNYDFILVVKNPFFDYKIGTIFSEDTQIEWVINNGFLPNCLKVARKSSGV